MSDTKVIAPSLLERLKAQVLSRVSHNSSAETVEDLVADVERVSRFVIVPPEFMEMLRDIAASSERHGAGSLHTSLKVQGADPEWANLIADMDDLVDFEDLKAELTELIGYPFKSRTFPTLLSEVARIKRVMKIPDEFIEVFEGIVERQKAREVEESAEVAKMAGLKGADPDFTKRLVALARSEGLSVNEFHDVDGLMERLRRLANVHTEIVHKLRPFEAELRGGRPQPEATTAAPDIAEEDGEEEPARRGEEQGEEKAEPIPVYVTTYSSIKGIEWGDGERTGSIGSSGDVLTMSAYGYAIFGTNRMVNFGIPVDPGMSAFLLSDPVSGMVSVGKFPYISSMEDALARIAATQRITQEDLSRDPGNIPAHTRKTARYRTIERLRSSTSPHEVELKRIGKQIGKLDIPVERFVAGAAFFSGRPGEKEFGAPPAQVITMLGALRSVGIGSVRMGMFFYPERGSSELLYDAEDGVLRVGRRRLLELDGSGAADMDEILSLASDIVRELEVLTADGKFVETIRTYHLPLAMGLWWNSLALLRRKVMGVIRTASRKEGSAQERYLLSTYLKWHSMLPSGKRGGSNGGGVPQKGGGGKSSWKSGHGEDASSEGAKAMNGSGEFGEIIEISHEGRCEEMESVHSPHYDDSAAVDALLGSVVDAGALPLLVFPSAMPA